MTDQGAHEDDYEGDDLQGDTPVLSIDTPEKKVRRAWQTVAVDGEPVKVRQPKGAFFIQLASVMNSGSDLEQAAAMEDVLDKVFDPDSAEHLRSRLDDDEDDFDVDDLGVILNKLRELWSSSMASGRRPTGPASASKRRPSRSGRPSTVRSRS